MRVDSWRFEDGNDNNLAYSKQHTILGVRFSAQLTRFSRTATEDSTDSLTTSF
jgi:hypothetical protein